MRWSNNNKTVISDSNNNNNNNNSNNSNNNNVIIMTKRRTVITTVKKKVYSKYPISVAKLDQRNYPIWNTQKLSFNSNKYLLDSSQTSM